VTRAVPIGIAAVGLLLAVARRARARLEGQRAPVGGRARAQGSTPSPEIRSLIEREANAQGVPPSVALAFAEVESGFNPRAFGDRDWPTRHPKQWQEVRARMPDNPAVNDPAAWGSYGLFGLLAAYHVTPHEHPHVLWNPIANTQRGVTAIKRALQRANGDVRSARLLYVGCGLDGSLCSARYAAGVIARLQNAAHRWRAPSAAPQFSAVSP
jgi:hypothetical protein